MRCYRIVSLCGRVELQPLDKSPMRAELSSVDIFLVEGISVLKIYSISVSLLLIHKEIGEKNIMTVQVGGIGWRGVCVLYTLNSRFDCIFDVYLLIPGYV